jgi:sterol desaturase/sphingolipid hydroxylase (fatty acid hydroxylase superfamily)
MGSLEVGARTSLVNRTHRVVRERAKQMTARRNRIRSLWVPLAVCASMVVILVTAVWTLLDEYELAPTGMPDASDQYMVLLLWFLPASAALLAMVWFRRAQSKRSRGEMAQ